LSEQLWKKGVEPYNVLNKKIIRKWGEFTIYAVLG